MRRNRSALLAACAGMLVAAGCGGSSHPAAQTPAPAATNGSASQAGASASAGPDLGTCVSGASYCDTFSDKGSGWTVTNADNYFANYDSYLGGTYRVGERGEATVPSYAPTSISKISPDYGVQVDVDALAAADPGQLGVICWSHQIQGSSNDGAFLFFVGGSKAEIVLWDNIDGSAHTIASQPISNDVLHPAGQPNHLRADCLQGNDVGNGGGAQAQLSLIVNGKPAVSVNYAKSAKNYDWAVGDKAGVLASGKGEDVFYDNFALTSACVPGGVVTCPTQSSAPSA